MLAFQCLNLGLWNQCFPYHYFSCSLFSVSLQGPQDQVISHNREMLQNRAKKNCISLYRTDTNEVQRRTLGNPPVVLVSIALAHNQPGSCCGIWRSEEGFKKAERGGFADTDRQFLPQVWGATEERAWLGLFESIALRGRYLGSWTNWKQELTFWYWTWEGQWWADRPQRALKVKTSHLCLIRLRRLQRARPRRGQGKEIVSRAWEGEGWDWRRERELGEQGKRLDNLTGISNSNQRGREDGMFEATFVWMKALQKWQRFLNYYNTFQRHANSGVHNAAVVSEGMRNYFTNLCKGLLKRWQTRKEYLHKMES